MFFPILITQQLLPTCRAISTSVWKWASISSSSCWMRTESGLTRYWLEARRSWGPILMEAEWTRRQFLTQDMPRLSNNTSPAIRRRMTLTDNVIKLITLTKYSYEAWWCGPGVKRVGVSSLKNSRTVIFPFKSSFEIKNSSEKFISKSFSPEQFLLSIQPQMIKRVVVNRLTGCWVEKTKTNVMSWYLYPDNKWIFYRGEGPRLVDLRYSDISTLILIECCGISFFSRDVSTDFHQRCHSTKGLQSESDFSNPHETLSLTKLHRNKIFRWGRRNCILNVYHCLISPFYLTIHYTWCYFGMGLLWELALGLL